MEALWQAAFSAENVVYTLLLGVVILYWLSVFLGAIDLGSLDLDFDFDAEVDMDVDADLEIESEVGTSAGWLAGALHFFNFGKLPFMVLLSFVVVPAWIISIGLNEYFNPGAWWFPVAMIILILFVSLIIGKLLSTPFVPLFAKMNTAAEPIDYIGRLCKLRMGASASKFGQAEVDIDGDVLLIEVKTESDDTPLTRGEMARIIGKTEDQRYFLVQREVVVT